MWRSGRSWPQARADVTELADPFSRLHADISRHMRPTLGGKLLIGRGHASPFMPDADLTGAQASSFEGVAWRALRVLHACLESSIGQFP
jgi:hypothetical protein